MSEAPKPSKASQGGDRAEALGANFSKLSALELGARRGLGPLSSRAEVAWHGDARPCVSCGQLILRTASRCDHCGQLLSGEMVHRMRVHSGPWYVLEHIRPFPGVSLERVILQIRRGVLTQTTIIRGPSTHHQWRFAAETPVISKFLGFCWACQAAVEEADSSCPVCRKDLDTDGEEGLIEGDETLEGKGMSAGRTSGVSGELSNLSAAVRSGAARRLDADEPARVGGIPVRWVIAVLVVLVMAAVYIVAHARRDAQNSKAAPEVSLIAPESGGDGAGPSPTDGETPGEARPD
ncbi:MAG: hypothetical protein GY842_08380 [bacterium]|nr:hypothetical protein [bacterium]